MTLNQIVKRVTLIILTLLAIAFIGLSLGESANSPQAQTSLDLIQTDLMLNVSGWQSSNLEEIAIKNVFVGSNSQRLYAQALEAYEQALESNQPNSPKQKVIQKSILKSEDIANLSLRLGILYAKVGKPKQAIAIWQNIAQEKSLGKYATTAQVLEGLWSQPGLIFPDAENKIRSNLKGWFRSEALERLYKAQQLDTASTMGELSLQRDLDAETSIEKLLLASSVTVIGGGLGVIFIAILGLQRLFFAQSSPLQPTTDSTWHTPWQLEKAWEVMVLWFTAYVAMSQIFLPTAIHILGIYPDSTWNSRDRAIFILIPYVASMAPMLLIFRGALRDFLPLPNYLFQLKLKTWNWLRWGLGGYIAAIPVILAVSALNQRLLDGQGGGNPLLPILVQDQNSIAKLLLWMTVAIAAPFFEELLFRGFLLPSLISALVSVLGQRFKSPSLATWLGIFFSGLGFAIAHLNLGDILPLTALGMMLGFIYVRSQNLLAPMLMHSLWNSGTFFTLLVLGSSGS
ncbi:putative metal-dependent membrane protease [Synechococcus sp. PCC 7502]|uniref:type II CAAX endopeptidase family protein n=1 Tax=Synechococcus sp. PCC 7502 TaxID=1173263 RepID=UPI00029FA1E1|nr:type II CAAX endopeptidase family protein [Synechococcus sp. PCC 7502]AFY72495.1 putative metal-dependent membrane protease [Synechococcus sp. PCC 7502]